MESTVVGDKGLLWVVHKIVSVVNTTVALGSQVRLQKRLFMIREVCIPSVIPSSNNQGSEFSCSFPIL
jgi:hypothetical protein